MEDQRISVETRQVELVLTNGLRLVGEMFLQLHGAYLAGPQRVGEVLNGEDHFFPVRTEGSVKLINLDQVVAVYTSLKEEFDPLLELGEEHQVRVYPTTGEPIETRIFVNLPTGHNRAKDFFNQPKDFLLFLLEKQVVYLSRKQIFFAEN